MNMNLIGVGQGNRTEEIGAVNKLEVRSVNRESTEKNSVWVWVLGEHLCQEWHRQDCPIGGLVGFWLWLGNSGASRRKCLKTSLCD